MHSLVIEDDPTTGDYVASGLRAEGNVVDLIDNGRDGLMQAMTGTYDVMVLDRMVPDVDGMSILRTLRASKNPTPVILLTALGCIEPERDEPADPQSHPRGPGDRSATA